MSPTTLITGGSRGIGATIARTLANQGHRLVLAARRGPAIEELLGELPAGGHESLVIDVADAGDWQAAASRLRDVRNVVCAAGQIGPIGRLEDLDAVAFAETLQVNVVGTMLALQACSAGLRAGGAAITFSGGGATGPFPRFDAYAASKAAVVRLTENLAADGLRVNAVAPGMIVTAMQHEVLTAARDDVGSEYFERVEAVVAAGGGDDPQRAAALVAFLLSDDAAGIRGKLLSAPWDPWEDEAFRARLATDPHLATLRRIDEQFYTCVR